MMIVIGRQNLTLKDEIDRTPYPGWTMNRYHHPTPMRRWGEVREFSRGPLLTLSGHGPRRPLGAQRRAIRRLFG